MGFLIDTNIVSELRRRRPANRVLFEWRDRVEGEPNYISVMTLLELEFGILGSEDQRRLEAPALRAWLNDTVLPQYRGYILPVDEEVALVAAKLQRIRTHGETDALIAATALVHDHTVVTRDTFGFVDTGVRLLNPFDLTSP